MKITEAIAATAGAPYVAFEYFPPRTAEGVANLHKRAWWFEARDGAQR
jgi:hypothetical protein